MGFSRILLLLWIVPLGASWVTADPSTGSSSVTKLDPKSGTVEFHATGHPSAIKIVGKGVGAAGSLTVSGTRVTGAATFDLTTLATGIEMRDKHMKEKYLEVGKFPQAKLTLVPATLPKALTGDLTLDSVPFSGTLSLHGVDHAVSGTARIVKAGGQVTLHAQFILKVGDYGIAIPSFAGITMADDVQVDVESTSSLGSNATAQ